MKAKIKNKFEVDVVELPFGVIKSFEDGRRVEIITTTGFKLILRDDFMRFQWTKNRPKHDHDNHPAIVVQFDEETPRVSINGDGYPPRILIGSGYDTREIDYWNDGESCKWKTGVGREKLSEFASKSDKDEV